MKIGFYGAGRVGCTLGRYFKDHGLSVTGYYNRTKERAEEAALWTGTLCYDSVSSLLDASDVFNEFTVIPTIGEPYLVMDTLGVMGENSLSWSSNGIDYYLVSDVMNQNELIEVAQSIGGIVSMK